METSIDSAAARLQRAQQQHEPVSQKHAAVLVPLFLSPDGVLSVVLTQRSQNMRTHQGEVCFPGGKRDAEDKDDVATALREAQEELGLPGSSVKVITQLPPVLSKHFLSVTPVVGFVPPTPAEHAPAPCAREVASVFSAPLDLFVDGGDAHSFQDIQWEGHVYRIHAFEHAGFRIWGLTAGILIQVAQVALGRPPSFQEHAPPEIGGVPYACFRHDGHGLRVSLPSGSPHELGNATKEAEGYRDWGA